MGELKMSKLEEICKEYDFDIVNRQRDETPVEVQFYGITKTMPRWKACEFGDKLVEMGFNPIIDGAFYVPADFFFGRRIKTEDNPPSKLSWIERLYKWFKRS